METLKQLAVFVANRPGTLSQICRTLADAGVNILGISVADAVDHAVLRFVVDQPAVAIHVLGETGLLVVDSDIIAIHLTNAPGKMSDLGRLLSDANVNIEYAYGGMSPTDPAGTLFLKVSDVDAAREVLKGLGV